MSINDATNVASATAASSTSSVKRITKSLSNNIFAKTLHQLRRKCYKNYFARSFDQLPIDTICELNPEIIAHYSGPDTGISDVSLISFRRPRVQNHLVVDEQSKNQKDKEKPPPLESVENNSNLTVINTSNPPVQVKLLTEAINVTNNKTNREITEKTLIDECLDSFFKSGITKWNIHHPKAYGIACSLYENNPVTKATVGDPIADVYAILTRKNSSILLLADGVNWGPRSRLAARCAVRASMNYINRNLFCPINSNYDYLNSNSQKCVTTHDLFKIMCRSFDAAQEFILQKKGTMTTLCCSVVVKLKDSLPLTQATSLTGVGYSNPLWAVCTLSIGDSTAYVFNRKQGVFELTYGARNLNDERDMRNVGGALGHVYGIKPDVSNLNYSVMYIRENDLVFLVSDGVSDNLDPCVSQTARKKKQNENDIPSELSEENNKNSNLYRTLSQKSKKKSDEFDVNSNKSSTSEYKKVQLGDSIDDGSINLCSLPSMNPYERYVCSLAHMNEILSRNKTLNETISAQETCAILIEHVLKLTSDKRDILEKGMLEAANIENDEEKARFQATLREKVLKIRGKLDHASIVAYEVGSI